MMPSCLLTVVSSTTSIPYIDVLITAAGRLAVLILGHLGFGEAVRALVLNKQVSCQTHHVEGCNHGIAACQVQL
jgi:hypothetical protein